MNSTSGQSSCWDITVNDTSGDMKFYNNHSHIDTSISAQWSTPSTTSGSGGCNESKAFDNDEKALYHGLKSAYRMSRTAPVGGEYGTADGPPYESAARIAANVAIAYLQVTGQEYTRTESFDYIDDEFARDPGLVESYFSDPPLDARVGEPEFEAAISHAWTQIDDKRNHYDSARTALAAADLFLGGELDGLVQTVTSEDNQ